MTSNKVVLEKLLFTRGGRKLMTGGAPLCLVLRLSLHDQKILTKLLDFYFICFLFLASLNYSISLLLVEGLTGKICTFLLK